jgi:hypothetical protein
MNSYQKLWWEQAKSDHKALAVVLRDGMAPCHPLHYLQFATEELAKAYLWRSGSPPPKSHAGFAKFLRLLGSTGKRHRQRVAKVFSFRRFADFQNWINAVIPIANELENLAPSLANDGPNPEYPWPHSRPRAIASKYMKLDSRRKDGEVPLVLTQPPISRTRLAVRESRG